MSVLILKHVTFPPLKLFVQKAVGGDALIYEFNPLDVHDNGKPVYVYQRVHQQSDGELLPCSRCAPMFEQKEKELTDMRQTRALDKNAWRRIGEILRLTEEESAHTSHVIATLAARAHAPVVDDERVREIRARWAGGVENIFNADINYLCALLDKKED